MRPVLVGSIIVTAFLGSRTASAADTRGVEAALTQWIGAAKDGWTPVAFVALRAGMSPPEVGQHFPGAEKTLRGTISKLRISGISHVQEAQFDFLTSRPDGQKGLDHVILTFERGFFDDAGRREALVRVLEGKFGPMRPGPSPMTKGFWRSRTPGAERMAQFIDWGRAQDLQLSFDFPPGPVSGVTLASVTPVRSTSVLHSASCRAVDVTKGEVMVEAVAGGSTECMAALKQKLRAARCVAAGQSFPYRLQHWVVGRWSNGVELTLRCR